MTVARVSLCYRCEHFTPSLEKPFWICKAFPKGIPIEIISWKHDHHEMFPGDNGVVFAEKRDYHLPGGHDQDTHAPKKKARSDATPDSLRDEWGKGIHSRVRKMMKAASKSSGSGASEMVSTIIRYPAKMRTPMLEGAIKQYVSSSGTFNNVLRGSGGDLTKLNPTGEAMKSVNILDRALREAKVFSVPVKVFRGWPSHVLADLKEGDVFVDHGYLSTSFSYMKARSFAGSFAPVVEITLPKRFPFLSIPSLNGIGIKSGLGMQEAEAILPRGTTMRVKKFDKGKNILQVEAIASTIPPKPGLQRKPKEGTSQ
jgi:hypothetical protein